MSGGAYAVDLAELEHIITRMASFQQSLQESMNEADQRVNRLHTTWSGAAAEAHAAAHQKWLAGAKEMHQALVTMRGIADTARANYSGAVSANVSMWSF